MIEIMKDITTTSSPELHFDDFSEQIHSVAKDFEAMKRMPEGFI
jgi:hypothetical protein